LAVSIKDLFDVAGHPTTAGSASRWDAEVAAVDAQAVARLRAAGAVLVGHTNLTEFAFSGVGINPHHVTPANPATALLDVAPRIPGGSTSGGGASVASGAAWAALGSDTGGSIRIPAALQGLVGFKNTQRLTPSGGCIPLSTTLDTACAITLTVRDAVVLHEVLGRLDDTASATNPDLLALPPRQMEAWNVPGMIAGAGWTAADFEAFRKGRPMQDLFVRAFREAGGRVVTGTDAANQMLVPGASEHTEMELLVRAGLTPAEALRAATRDAADLLGADSLGTLVPGKAADLVVLSKDPLADITNTRTVTRVMIRGRLILADSIRNRW